MKTKVTLATFLALFGTSINSFAGYIGDYCPFSGVIDSPNWKSEEEFKWLLEPEETPNFIAMSSAVGVVAMAPTKTLKDHSCNISKYARQLLEYYKKHKEEIKNNAPDVVDVLEIIQTKVEKK